MEGGEGGEGRRHLCVHTVDQTQCSVMKELKSFINIVLGRVVFYINSRLCFDVRGFHSEVLRSDYSSRLQHHGEFSPL